MEPSFLVLRSPLLPAVPSAAGLAQEAAQAPGAAAVLEANSSPFGQFQTLLASRVMGTSGKDGDKIHQAAQLPLLRVGDWLMFPYAGAYTVCSASNTGCGSFLRPARLFVFSAEADKGWGDILPQESVSIMIPPTIPEHAEVLHDGEVDGGADGEAAGEAAGAGAAAAAAVGLEGFRSLSIGRTGSQSLQRSLSRVPSRRRG